MEAKKKTLTAIATALVALGVGAVSAPTASAHKLPVSYVQARATNVAIDWYLSSSQWDSYWVNNCSHWPRGNPHKASCDAYVAGTHYGDIHCGSYSCSETDTTTTCWKRVKATVRGNTVHYQVKYPHCSTQSNTDYF